MPRLMQNQDYISLFLPIETGLIAKSKGAKNRGCLCRNPGAFGRKD